MVKTIQWSISPTGCYSYPLEVPTAFRETRQIEPSKIIELDFT